MLEIGVELRIGGTQEFWFSPANLIRISCQHQSVRIDGTQQLRMPFYGPGMVHPTCSTVHQEFPNTTNRITLARSADGLSEGKVGVDPTGPTKRLKYPIRILQQIQTTLVGLEHSHRTVHLANVLAHEIGHCLGLEHALEIRPGAQGYFLPPSNPDVARAIMSWEDLGAFRVARPKRFGPVHRDLIARSYYR